MGDGSGLSLGSGTLTRTRRGLSRRLSQLSIALFLAPVCAGLTAQALNALALGGALPPWLISDVWLFAWFPCFPVSMVLAHLLGVSRSRWFEGLEVEGGELRLRDRSGVRVYPTARLKGALVVDAGELEVEVLLEGGDVLQIPAAGREEQLVAALGFAPAERRTAIPLGPARAAAASCGGIVGGVIATVMASVLFTLLSASVPFLAQHLSTFLGLLFVALTLLVTRITAWRRIIIGADGVLIEGAFSDEIVPFSSLADVRVGSSSVELVVRTGRRERVVHVATEEGPRRVAVADRIRAAMIVARAGAGAPASALLSRGGRSLAEWRAALARLTRGAGYRGESLPGDALLQAAGDAEASADQRLGAALAIGMGADPEAKRRLRVAVEGIVDDKMRAAMASAARGDGDDAAIEAAIEEAILAEESARRGGKRA